MAHKDFKKDFLYSSLYLFLIFILHAIAMIYFEGHSLEDSLWLSITTMTTVGYGDVPINTTWGRIATVLIMYVGGIFVLAKTVGDYFYYRNAKDNQQLHGEWRWNMSGHIVIISNHNDFLPELYYGRLIREFKQVNEYKNLDIEILTNHFPNGLPKSLQHLGVVHYQGDGNVPEDLEAVNIDSAVIIVVLAKRHHDPTSDGNSFDILHRIRDINKTAFILAETVDDINRERLRQAGANITIRPVHAYPEMIVSVLSAPGSEIIIENMFTHHGDKYQRFDIVVSGEKWAKVVYQLMEADIGTAIGYISNDNQVHCNPSGFETVNAKALIIMVKK